MATKKKLTQVLKDPSVEEAMGAAYQKVTGDGGVLTFDQSAPQETTDQQMIREGRIHAAASAGDFWDAMNREDGIIARGIGWWVGNNEFSPDPAFRPLSDENWKKYSEGVAPDLQPEFQKALQGAMNPAHAEYIRGMVVEKQQDRELLGTMGTVGQAARFANGLIQPEQLALGLASGGVTELAAVAGGAKTLNAARKMGQAAAKIEDKAVRAGQMAKAAQVMEEAARARAGAGAVAAGFGTAAASGAAFEALRQSVNFEDDSSKILDSTLMSVAFSAPFIGLGAMHMNRVTKAAAMEREVLGIMERMHKGETLSEAEFGKLREYGYYIDRLGGDPYNFERGSQEIRDRAAARDDIRDRWMDRNDEEIGAPKGDDGTDIGEPPPGTGPADPPGTGTGTRKKDVISQVWDPKDGRLLKLTGHKWADDLVKALKTGKAIQVTGHEILNKLLPRFESTHLGPVIKAMLAHPELNTLHHLSTGTNPTALGLHWGWDKNVTVTYVKSLSHLSDREAQTFVHEYAHAFTVHALEGNLDSVLTARQKQAVENIKALHKQAQKVLSQKHGITKRTWEGGGEFYGLTNPKEFVSEVLSNKKFQEHLMGIDMGNKKNMLSNLWDSIKSVLGLGKDVDSSMLAHAIANSDALLGARFQARKLKSTTFDRMGPGIDLGVVEHSVATINEAPIVPTGPSVMGFVEIGGKKLPIRWDIAQVLDNNVNPHIRQMGFDMVKNAIGYKGDKAQGITISERKERIRRVVAGEAHFTMQEALREALNARGMNIYNRITQGFDKSFYEMVTKVARGDAQVLLDNRDIAPQLGKAAQAMRKFYDTMGQRAVDSGLAGAENLNVGGNYVNRVYKQNAIAAMMKEHGPQRVYDLFAAAFHNPLIKGNTDVAQKFVSAIQKLEYKKDFGEVLLGAKDMGTLRTALEDAGLSPAEINSIVDVMFEKKEQAAGDAGKPTQLHHRMDLDETASIKTALGEELKISDLFENDARVLVDKYTNTMGGHIAFAEHGWTNPLKDFADRVRASEEWVAGRGAQGYDTAKHKADITLLEDMFNNITGKPMSTQTFNRLDQTLGALRAYTRSVMLGQLGLASAMELKNAMALSAFHGAWSQMPNFSKIISMLRKGIPVDDQLAKDIQHIAGFGNEYAMQYARQHELSDHTYGRNTSRFQNFAERAADVVDTISGNKSFTSATRNLAAKFTVQHLYDIGAGKKTLDAGFTQRLVHNGIDQAHIKATLDDLKAHSIADPSGVVQSIDWEGWQQANRKTYEDFSLALERFTRDGIQDHNIGETMPWMHTTTGKIIAELRTFNLVAHSKQFLKNAHYHDRTSAMVFMTSFVGEALAYSVQSSINFAHNPTELDRRLTTEAIAKAALQRMGSLGVLSYAIETPFKALTGQSFFGQGTNNTDNRDLLMTPSMMVIKRMVNGSQTAAQALSPMSNTVTTKQEVKDAIGNLPGGNTWGIRNVTDAIASTFPKTDPTQYKH